jgi:hypothetical protein
MLSKDYQSRSKLIPIYTSHGDLGGFLLYPYIYSTLGEWIGWVTSEKQVYSVHGHFVGVFSPGPRILRRRESANANHFLQPPAPPPPIRPPTRVPLAPQMPEVTLNMIDVLEEAPDLLPPADFGELRQDMD